MVSYPALTKRYELSKSLMTIICNIYCFLIEALFCQQLAYPDQTFSFNASISCARGRQSISTLDGNCMLKVNEAFTKVLKNATHANDDNVTFRWLYLAAKVKSTDEVCMRTAAQVRGYALK